MNETDQIYAELIDKRKDIEQKLKILDYELGICDKENKSIIIKKFEGSFIIMSSGDRKEKYIQSISPLSNQESYIKKKRKYFINRNLRKDKKNLEKQKKIWNRC